jgi:hypothetical protein
VLKNLTMKKKEEHTVRRNDSSKIGLRMTLARLIMDNLLQSSAIKEATDKLARAISNASLLRVSYDDKVKKEQSNVKTIENCKEKLIEVASVPKETRNEEMLTELVTCIKMCRSDVEKLQEEIRTTRRQVEVAEDEERKMKFALDTLKDPERMLAKEFKIHQKHTFLNGFHNAFGLYTFKVSKDPTQQEFRMINLQRLFPEWKLLRLVYCSIIQELIDYDDIRNNQRTYAVGIAKDLFEEVFENDQEVWCSNRDEEKKKWFYSHAPKLGTWLAKPLFFEELLTDPLFKAFTENWRDYREKDNPYKGGVSALGQLLEFISFSKEHLAKEESVLEA